MKQPGGGKALLVEQPTLMNGERSEFPSASTSLDRCAGCHGARRRSADEIASRITELLQTKPPQGIVASWRCFRGSWSGEVSPGWARRKQSVAGDRLARRRHRFDRLPLMKCWPEDGGAYITVPMVITRDRSAGSGTSGCIASCRRAEIPWRCTGSDTKWRGTLARDGGERRDDAGVHRPRRRSAGDVLRQRAAPADDRRVPVRCFLRRHPCSSPRRSPAISRYRRRRISSSRGSSIRDALVTEGPVGDHTALFTRRSLSAGTVTAITMRAADLSRDDRGAATMEDSISATPPSGFFAVAEADHPEIVDYHMPAEGIFHNLVSCRSRRSIRGRHSRS